MERARQTLIQMHVDGVSDTHPKKTKGGGATKRIILCDRWHLKQGFLLAIVAYSELLFTLIFCFRANSCSLYFLLV